MIDSRTLGTVLAIWFGYFLFLFSFVFVYSFWTDRNLDYWATYCKGEAVDVPGWVSFAVSIIPLSLPANIIAEVAKFFI